MSKYNLQHRAHLAYNGTLNATDEQADYLPYQHTFLSSTPAELRHIIMGADAAEIVGRHLLGLLYARNMLDIKEPTIVEESLVNRLCALQDMNRYGLCSQPETPWSKRYTIAPWGEPQRMMFEAFLVMYRNGREAFEGRLDRFVEGVLQRENDWLIHKKKEEDSMVDYNLKEQEDERLNPFTTSWLLDPLVRYYTMTSKPRVLELIDRIVAEHPILNDPLFIENSSIIGHMHTKLSGVTGLLRYAYFAGDQALIDKCKMCYEWFLKNRGSTIGWFTEMNKGKPITEEDCETCVLTNMIELAILLAKYTGEDRYWNDAEAFTKNQLMEQQLTSIDWIPNALRFNYYASDNRRSFYDILPRSIGIFHGNSAPNDFVGINPPCNFRTMTGCCTSWGIRALYLAWHNALSKSDDSTIHINMGFERSSQDVELRCCEPYEGRMEILMKRAGALKIRVPSWNHLRYNRRLAEVDFNNVMERWGSNWMDRRFIRCRLNSAEIQVDTGGPFVTVDHVKAGDRVEVFFPLRWEKYEEEIGGRKYMLEWLGNYCVNIEPKGLVCPAYDRQNMKFGAYPIKMQSFPWPASEYDV